MHISYINTLTQKQKNVKINIKYMYICIYEYVNI